MKKVLGISLIVLLMGVSLMQADAQTLTANAVKTDVSNVLQKQLQPLTDAEIEVKVSAVNFAQIIIPDGKITYKIIRGGDKVIARDIKSVELHVNGTCVRTLHLPVQTIMKKEVLVATTPINMTQAITNENVVMKKMDISLYPNYVLTNDALSKEMSAKKCFREGEIIDKRFVITRPDVVRNGEVKIIFSSNDSVMITIDGTALMDGQTGDYISVENKKYKKVYSGKVIGENKVLVSI